jgi:DNA-binding NtrC family response regulator
MSKAKHSILIVDDEQAQRQGLSGALGKEYAVVAASDGVEATQLLAQRSFDLIITDERMPRMGGIELIKWVCEKTPETPVILLAAGDSVEAAVEALGLGVEYRLAKPLKDLEELRLVIGKVLHWRALRDLNLLHQADTEAKFPPEIIARSKEMQRVLKMAEQVAAQSTTVLLTGESGTGKEAVARFIHRHSQRSEGPFVAVNCAPLSESLLESELFGHEKGAIAAASQSRRGRLELAHGGTLFLDEVGSVGASLQVRLLRVLGEGKLERIGSTRAIHVDVRVIAATHKDLQPLIQAGTFREDLFYRLNEFPIHIPPLRERREAILPLAEHFARQAARRMGRPFTGINVDAASMLYQHDWPGNVRELANAMERALIVAKSDVIKPEELPLPIGGRPPGTAQGESLAGMEKAAIIEALARNGGHRRKTAGELGISLRTLQYRLKEYGLIGNE